MGTASSASLGTQQRCAPCRPTGALGGSFPLMTRQKLKSNYLNLIRTDPHPLNYLYISGGVSSPHPPKTIFLRRNILFVRYTFFLGCNVITSMCKTQASAQSPFQGRIHGIVLAPPCRRGDLFWGTSGGLARGRRCFSCPTCSAAHSVLASTHTAVFWVMEFQHSPQKTV